MISLALVVSLNWLRYLVLFFIARKTIFIVP